MLKFAANLTHLFAELPYLDRFDAAAKAGFKAVEVLFPYEVAAQETLSALTRNGLGMVLINAPPPNYTGGPRGFAAMCGLEDRFRYDMRRVFRYAEVLGVNIVHVMAGVAEGADARAVFVENLKYAADAAPAGLMLTIEPLNPVAQPGYFLNSFDLAVDVIAAVDAPNLALQFDSYHAQTITGDAVACYNAVAPFVRHIQIGDAPDRTAPGTGVVEFDALFQAIEASGYEGWISAEYDPRGKTEDSLVWRRGL
ncbi:TIM barrel protein [Ascidiaceihabitans sp.]|uniref:hydroxypyruvate isomerase family protein n=1 Tax=Ascidiaceihabitans sp. TaxID=1872644 RepID=UPI0032998682